MSLDLSKYDVNGASHLGCAADGEYEVKITGLKLDDDGDFNILDSNGNPYMLPTFEILGENADDYKSFTQFIRLPYDDMSAKELKECLANIKDFGMCFEIDFGRRLTESDIIDHVGIVVLGTKPDEGYGEKNNIRQYLIKR